jgi:diguanylate cyclase (GGDEF)-like protein
MPPTITFQKRITNLLSAGMQEEPSPETLKKLHLAFLINSLAISMMFIFAAEAMFKGNVYNAFFLFFLATLVIINFIILRFSGKEHLFYNLSVLVMAAMCIYLLSTGGVGNTGPLWIYIFPLLSLYLLGIKKGSISLLFLFGYAAFLFLIPNSPFALVDYSATFQMHFVASMVTVSVLSYFYEFSTQKSYDKLLTISLGLEKVSLSDFLTGLANRRKILQHIEHEKNRYERQANAFSIILCDIDYFKKINDTYGHDCGDFVLKSIAGTFTESLRKVDIASRWGGEEFLILLPESDQQRSFIVAERLRKAIEQLKIQYKNTVVKTTMSFGVATWKKTAENFDLFIKQADENLYRAKEEGRNRVIAS